MFIGYDINSKKKVIAILPNNKEHRKIMAQTWFLYDESFKALLKQKDWAHAVNVYKNAHDQLVASNFESVPLKYLPLVLEPLRPLILGNERKKKTSFNNNRLRGSFKF